MTEREPAAEQQVEERSNDGSAAGKWSYELPNIPVNRTLMQRVTGKTIDGRRRLYHCGLGCCGPKKKHQLKCPHLGPSKEPQPCKGFFKCAFCYRCKYFVVSLTVSHRMYPASPEGRPRTHWLPSLQRVSSANRR